MQTFEVVMSVVIQAPDASEAAYAAQNAMLTQTTLVKVRPSPPGSEVVTEGWDGTYHEIDTTSPVDISQAP